MEHRGDDAAREEVDTSFEFLKVSDADFEDTFLGGLAGDRGRSPVNDFYDSHEEFLHAVDEALKPEDERIVDAGRSSFDARDLLTTGCRGLGGRPIEKLKPVVRMHVEALEEATRSIPDCGFDTQSGLATVHPGIAWARVDALVDGAAVATERLFG
ncbi:hypothetical protein [Halobellus ruber]|uniref:Uncharacterized protein n=1 Tax=Halobellus ruber TaxID=2761102 RepID=A0A7J9SFY3_9EURY|nr:hypothetical protein [Halobellus ruber]MBB6644906.1 hypothetical protein [Halobellus ruber]